MKKYLFYFLGLIFLILFLKFLLFSKKPIPVKVKKVERGVVEEIVTNTRAGTFKTKLKAKLSPRTAGLVLSIPHKKGDFVKKGDLLLKIDDSIQRANLEAAKKQKEAIDAKLKEAEVSFNLSKKDEMRAFELLQNEIISQNYYDKAKAEMERAESILNSTKSLLKQAEAEVKLAEENLNLTKLYAPFDGFISEVYTEIGEWITPSPTGLLLPPVMEIINLEEFYVSAPIDEMDSKKVKIGNDVRVTLDSYPKKIFKGTLNKIGVYVQDLMEQNRTVEVEVKVELEGLDVLPGTSADVEIITNRKENVLIIPTTAISSDGNVFVIEKGKIKIKKIKTGIQNWAVTEVIEGAKEGEIIVSTLERMDLKEGQKVHPLAYD